MNRNERIMSRRKPAASQQKQDVGTQEVSVVNRVTALKGSEGGNMQPAPGQARLDARRQQINQNPSQYRDEYGFKMTDDEYKAFQGKETAWDNELKGYESKIGGYQKEINTARSNLAAEQQAKESEIKSAQSRLDEANKVKLSGLLDQERAGWTKVNVVSGPNHSVEGTYYLPRKGVEQLHTLPYRYQNYKDGQYYISVKAANGGNRGAELHSALGKAQSDVEKAWIEKAQPEYQKAREAIRTGYDQLNSARAQLINSYNAQLSELYTNETTLLGKQQDITRARSAHQAELDTYKTDYEKRRKGRRALFGMGGLK